MKRTMKRKDLLEGLFGIAFGKANDVVKLALGEPPQKPEEFENLDLTLLSEIKRHANGALEIKLIDRLEALQLLFSEVETKEKGMSGAEQFFRAMGSACDKKDTAGDKP